MEGERQKNRAESWGATSMRVTENPPRNLLMANRAEPQKREPPT